MGDYNLKVTVRNGRILRLMRAAGFETQTELAKAAGVDKVTVNGIVTMRKKPQLPDGEWSEPVHRMASALGCMPEEMFNETQATGVLLRSTFEVDLNDAQLSRLSNLDGDMERLASTRMLANDLIEQLPTEREKIIVRGVMDGDATTEIAEQIGVSQTRVNQIYNKALRKMWRYGRKYNDAKLLGFGDL